MTLEKLLIFGFALAVAIALAVSATTISDNRAPQNSNYQTKVKGLVNATSP